MKCSLGISNFIEENSSLFHSIVFLYFTELIIEEDFLSFLAILWNSAFRCLYLSFSPLPSASFLFTDICKASPDGDFSFLRWVRVPGCNGAGAAERSYPTSEVMGSCREELPPARSQGRQLRGMVSLRVQEGREELLHVQGQERQR